MFIIDKPIRKRLRSFCFCMTRIVSLWLVKFSMLIMKINFTSHGEVQFLCFICRKWTSYHKVPLYKLRKNTVLNKIHETLSVERNFLSSPSFCDVWWSFVICQFLFGMLGGSQNGSQNSFQSCHQFVIRIRLNI